MRDFLPYKSFSSLCSISFAASGCSWTILENKFYKSLFSMLIAPCIIKLQWTIPQRAWSAISTLWPKHITNNQQFMPILNVATNVNNYKKDRRISVCYRSNPESMEHVLNCKKVGKVFENCHIFVACTYVDSCSNFVPQSGLLCNLMF